MFVLLLEKYKAVFKCVSFQGFEIGHPLRIKGWPLRYVIGWLRVYGLRHLSGFPFFVWRTRSTRISASP